MKFVISFLAGLAFSQGAGRGVSKDTRACSAGVIDTTYAFMTKYFPVDEADDDCPNRQCTCGTQARVALSSSWDTPYHWIDGVQGSQMETERRLGVSSGFGLHCVYAAGTDDARVKQSGNMTQEALEKVFYTKFGDMSTWNEFMDYNTGLFTDDISSFATAVKDGGVDYMTLNWKDGSTSYVSVLVNPPKTHIIHEVVGESSYAPEWLMSEAQNHPGTRFHFGEKGNPRQMKDQYNRRLEAEAADLPEGVPAPVPMPPPSGGSMTPLWISRAATDLDESKTWLKNIFQVTDSAITESSGTDSNGDSYDMIEAQVSNQATVKFRIVKPKNYNKSSDGYSVQWFQDYTMDVHKQWMTSIHCGWDLLGDNHSAFDWQGSYQSPSLDSMVEAMEAMGGMSKYPYFCKGAMHGTHCYFSTPWAYQVQMDGPYNDPPSTISSDYPKALCATYQEHC